MTIEINFYDIFIDFEISTRIDDNVKKGYVVWNDNCQIPNISAYDDSIKHLIKKSNHPKCFANASLTNVVLNVSTWSYTLKINHDLKSIINCCYSSIVRNELKFKTNLKDDDRYT